MKSSNLWEENIMRRTTRRLLASTACLVVASAAAQAQISDNVVRIGVLTDMSGIYSDLAGVGAVEAVRMAAEDFGGEILGAPIEVIFSDHLNQADTAAAKAREWFEIEGVDLINDLSNSGAALAVAGVARDMQRHIIVNGSSNIGVTNEVCSPYAIHYAYDAYSLAHGTGNAVVQDGGLDWFFLTVDFAFGIGLEEQVTQVVEAAGGQVLGSARHPLAATDFSSYMLQAQSSGAEIVGIASTGGDAINAINAAAEFGLTRNQTLAALLLWINDVHSIGLEAAQGLMLTNAWYWDMSPEAREFSERYYERVGMMPNMSQAANYSSTMHFLRAIEARSEEHTSE